MQGRYRALFNDKLPILEKLPILAVDQTHQGEGEGGGSGGANDTPLATGALLNSNFVSCFKFIFVR